MGMFDTFVNADGRAWQTKPLSRSLKTYSVGMQGAGNDPVETYQIEIRAAWRTGTGGTPSPKTLATVRNSILTSLSDKRDKRLPLLDYLGRRTETGRPALPGNETEERLRGVERLLNDLAREEVELHKLSDSDLDARDAAIAALRRQARQLILNAQPV